MDLQIHLSAVTPSIKNSWGNSEGFSLIISTWKPSICDWNGTEHQNSTLKASSNTLERIPSYKIELFPPDRMEIQMRGSANPESFLLWAPWFIPKRWLKIITFSITSKTSKPDLRLFYNSRMCFTTSVLIKLNEWLRTMQTSSFSRSSLRSTWLLEKKRRRSKKEEMPTCELQLTSSHEGSLRCLSEVLTM